MRTMTDTLKKNCIIMSVICAINLIASIIFVLKLPETVPTHFNFNMVCDGIGSRWTGLLPSILLTAIIPMLIFGETHGKNKSENHKPMLITIYMSTFIVVLANWIVLMLMDSGADLGEKIDMKFTWIFMLIFGFSFMIIGNYMPTVRHNYVLGVKLPWTLKNENCWNLTHRFTGKVYVAAGIISLMALMIGKIIGIGDNVILLVFTLVIVPVSVIIPICYAYSHRND